MAMTKAQLQEKYDALVIERDDLLKAQAEFIDDVLKVAEFGAVEHDLCTELEACLKMLGIEVPTQTVVIERVIAETYEFPGFQALRSGLMNADDEARVRAFNDREVYGFGYDGDTPLEDFSTGEESETVRVLIKAA